MTISLEPIPTNDYKEVFKGPKEHNRSIVGIEVFQDAHTRQMTMATFAHDSLKLWTITAFEDEFSLFPVQTMSSWNCGIQSYTTSEDGKCISLVSTDSSLHHISMEEENLDKPHVEIIQNGLMQIWFILTCTAMPGHFLTVNFQSSQLQILDQSGHVIQAEAFERARQVSAISYSEQYISAGSSQGVIYVVNTASLATLYSVEAHAMKVRCLVQFTGNGNRADGVEGGEEQPAAQERRLLLSGSDDKTIKLFDLSDTKAQLLRIFCGHKGIITGLAICGASGGERFASSGTDNCLIVWETGSGEKLHILANCTATLNDVPRCVRFTPNGRYLLAGTEEATILAWRVPQPEGYAQEEEEMMNGDYEEEMGQRDGGDGGEDGELMMMEEEMADRGEEEEGREEDGREEDEEEQEYQQGGREEDARLDEYEPEGAMDQSAFPAYGEVSSPDEDGGPGEAEGQQQNEETMLQNSGSSPGGSEQHGGAGSDDERREERGGAEGDDTRDLEMQLGIH